MLVDMEMALRALNQGFRSSCLPFHCVTRMETVHVINSSLPSDNNQLMILIIMIDSVIGIFPDSTKPCHE